MKQELTRGSFLKMATGALAASGLAEVAGSAEKPVASGRLVKPLSKPRNPCPYDGLDWSACHQINTTSHGHCMNQAALDCYLKHNFGFMTISNYYPGAPTMPGKTIRRWHYRVHHDHPVVVNGKRTDGPFDWNEIVKPLVGELDEKFRKQYPFTEGDLMFPNWPDGMLEAPNGEHYGFKMADGTPAWSLHLCCPGSAFMSGTFDSHYSFHTDKLGYSFSSSEFWGTAIDRMIEKLVCPDGGGVTINHPTWTHLKRELMLEILDWDPRVLGMEVLEHGFNSEHYWDWALATGRQAFGFFVPDWGFNEPEKDFGVNVLVVPERTVHACLKAYRQGDFYGAAHGLGELRFTRIAYDGATVVAETDKPAHFEVKTARGVRKTADGTRVEWTKPNIPKNKRETGSDIFARVKAYAADGCGETLFSQAFML